MGALEVESSLCWASEPSADRGLRTNNPGGVIDRCGFLRIIEGFVTIRPYPSAAAGVIEMSNCPAVEWQTFRWMRR